MVFRLSSGFFALMSPLPSHAPLFRVHVSFSFSCSPAPPLPAPPIFFFFKKKQKKTKQKKHESQMHTHRYNEHIPYPPFHAHDRQTALRRTSAFAFPVIPNSSLVLTFRSSFFRLVTRILLDHGDQATKGLGPYFRVGGVPVACCGGPGAIGEDGGGEVSCRQLGLLGGMEIGGGGKGRGG